MATPPVGKRERERTAMRKPNWMLRLVLPKDSLSGDELEQIFHDCHIDYPGRDIEPLELVGILMERSIMLGKEIESERQNPTGQ